MKIMNIFGTNLSASFEAPYHFKKSESVHYWVNVDDDGLGLTLSITTCRGKAHAVVYITETGTDDRESARWNTETGEIEYTDFEEARWKEVAERLKFVSIPLAK